MKPRLLPAHSLASGELAADEERRDRSHESRGHEASVDGIIGHRIAAQHSPHQNPALGQTNTGCLGVAGRAGVNLVSLATNGGIPVLHDDGGLAFDPPFLSPGADGLASWTLKAGASPD